MSKPKHKLIAALQAKEQARRDHIDRVTKDHIAGILIKNPSAVIATANGGHPGIPTFTVSGCYIQGKLGVMVEYVMDGEQHTDLVPVPCL